VLTRRGPQAIARFSSLAVAALAAVAVGCHEGDSTGGQTASQPSASQSTGKLKCEAVSSAEVVVSPPVVDIKDGVMRISGTIHRLPGVPGLLDGRVDVDLIGPDGLRLDRSLHCHLEPAGVPMDPGASAAYSPTPFGYVPPDGSTLRARYVDRQAAVLEDLKDGDLDYNGNGGHIGNDVPRSQENGSMPTNSSGGGSGS
jgi:hypothetical protein